MNHLTKNDSIINQTHKKLDDFDHYINRFTLNIQEELDLAADFQYGAKKLYHSKAQEQTTLFHDSLKSDLEHEIKKKQRFLASSIKTSALLKSKITNQRTLTITSSALGGAFSGGALVGIKTAFTQRSMAQKATQDTSTALSDAQNGIKDTENEIDAMPDLAGTMGNIVILASAAVVVGRMGYIAKEGINHHIKKHGTERISDYLKKDQAPIVDLICTLFTLYAVEQLDQQTLNKSKINRWAKEKCDVLMKNLTKQKKEAPHRIYDALLQQSPSPELYALEERKSVLKHWLGALETTIKKDKKCNKNLNVFLKKLEELRQKTEQQNLSNSHSSLIAPLISKDSPHFFSAQKKDEKHIENTSNEYLMPLRH